ncbi:MULTISPECIES: PadR family transcriptional regulator [Pedobacter]|uniref:Helix-turn-helix transcriptional regulator n=3 Tax=Pedobacter TaxID=84567 RepID=A0A7G9QIT6_9SPHI|nr:MULTISPECIES: PadR family transcriptional regulator [Pedobacter]NII81567.1 DNA-binding PadR family transcriptional regulator [Pedobacter sp. SG908]NMN35571.1 DNA-binding PadR family transcriptional regulator [Pedobacter sp. SG918]QNN43261.1 helix-turn-helix transcriptional regulator [Pedobacter roseus]QNR85509.1 helix-turn-helix transcriptional regulator [Pedobacter riviphilus]
MAVNNELFKGTLQTIILNLLSENEKMYGYEITQKVKSITQGELMLKEGALYPALHKLEAEGLLETTTEVVENRVRKYYSLSKDGEKEVVNKLQEAKDFIAQLQLLLNLKPAI